jgi:hypothetical protein
LQVEQLEQRLVPTVNLSNMEIGFGFGKGTLFVQGEQIQGGQATFWGGFEDPNGNWIPIKGQLQQMGSWGPHARKAGGGPGQLQHMGSWDQMTFKGSAYQLGVGESVNFSGWVNEANLKPWLGGTWVEGTLSETFTWMWGRNQETTTSSVSGYAEFIPT